MSRADFPRTRGARSRGSTSLAVQLEELRLVRARRVEHQVLEAEVEVGRIFSTCSSGSVETIKRDAACSTGSCVGQPLHLDRVLDAALLLRGQRQRAPELGVLPAPVAVVIEGHLHLDQQVEVVQRPAGLAGALGQRRQQGVASTASRPCPRW